MIISQLSFYVGQPVVDFDFFQTTKAGDTFSVADCAAAPALFYADWATRSARHSQMSMPIGDGCSHGLPLHGRWTRRGHIVHSSHSVRPIVTDHKEEKGVVNWSWGRKTRYAAQQCAAADVKTATRFCRGCAWALDGQLVERRNGNRHKAIFTPRLY